MTESVTLYTGKANICNLFLCEKDLQGKKPQLQETYVNLLEKFEVVLKINSQEVIIPSLMPDRGQYPKPSNNLSDVTMAAYHQDCYQPPLRRIWLSHFIPDGFLASTYLSYCQRQSDQKCTQEISCSKLIFSSQLGAVEDRHGICV